MGRWCAWQSTSLRGNRFYRRPERSHCFGLSLFRQSSLKQQMRNLNEIERSVKAIELKSLTAAGKAVKLPKSNIRSEIKDLEDR